jgi:hypothetical protein
MPGYSANRVKRFTLVGVLFLMPLLAGADTGGTVSFLDGNANATFTDTTGRTTGSCQGHSCTVNIMAPEGFTWAGALLVDVWLNPGTTNVKDVLCGDIYGFSGHCIFSANVVTLQFVAEGAGPLGTFPAGMQLEEGILKDAGNIVWMNSARAQITDSLQLESAAAVAVPEPSSLVILAGLFAVGLVTNRRRNNPRAELGDPVKH